MMIDVGGKKGTTGEMEAEEGRELGRGLELDRTPLPLRDGFGGEESERSMTIFSGGGYSHPIPLGGASVRERFSEDADGRGGEDQNRD